MTEAARARHPLAETLRRGQTRVHRGCHLGAAIGPTSKPEWTQIAQLRSDDRALDATLAAIGREVGTPRRDVQGSLLLESYAWQLVLPLAGAHIAESRVPMPGTHGTALLLTGEGRPRATRLLHGRFACLRQDPAAKHADAYIASNQALLDRCLRNALLVHFEPLVEAVGAASGRSRRALWRTVADRAAMALLYAGLACNRVEKARTAAERALTGDPPLQHPLRYAELDGGPCLHRHGCCLWWRTAAATTCLTCPLRTSTGAIGDCRRAHA